MTTSLRNQGPKAIWSIVKCLQTQNYLILVKLMHGEKLLVKQIGESA